LFSVSTGHKQSICAGTKEKIMTSSSCLKDKELIPQYTEFSLNNFYETKRAKAEGARVTEDQN